MNRKFCKSMLGVTFVLGLGLAVPAEAQVAAPVETTEVPAAEASPAAPVVELAADPAATPAEPETPEASPAAASDDLSEVIVTARRVQERLQDVPISITVFNQDQLTERNVSSGADLATYTPSLSANTRYGSDNASFAIRGFSQESRTTASVGVYFADVVAPRAGSPLPGGDGAGPGSFFDLANVQVLKGPQGTLFGRNTTGGAVLLIPQKPTSSFEGFVENTLGDYNLQHTTAVVNVPLSDNLRFRVGADRKQRDGYLNNTSGVGPKDFADIGYSAYRASLVWDLAPNLENYTIASYSLSDTNGNVPKIIACNASSPRTDAPFACAQLASEAGKGKYAIGNGYPDANTRTEQWQVINTTTWTLSDALTVKNIVSYAELKNDLNVDVYGAAFITGSTPPNDYGADANIRIAGTGSSPPTGLHTIDQSTMTEELQFQGSAIDGRLAWQAGGYLESSDALHPNGSQSQQDIHCDDTATLDCYDVVGKKAGRFIGNLGYQAGEIDFSNYGLYAQSTFELTETLKATAGLRYTNDTMEGEVINGRWIFAGPNADQPMFYCNNPDAGPTNPGPRNPDGSPTNAPVADKSLCTINYKKKTDAPTWTVGLDYKPVDDVLLYGKYSRGYRQGGVSPYSPPPAAVFDAEQVDTYEIGAKTSFRGAVRGSFNVAIFYNDFQDQQLSVGFITLDGRIPGNVGIVNAGKSRIQGAEVEMVLLPLRGLNLSLSYAYLDSEILEVAAPPPPAPYDLGVPLAVKGDRLPYTPESKLSTTAAYTLPLDPNIGSISIAATYTYQSHILVNRSSPYGFPDSYGLVNLNLNWSDIAGGPVDAGLFVTNLTNEYYYPTVSGGFSSFGFESAYLGEPRMFGARVRVKF